MEALEKEKRKSERATKKKEREELLQKKKEEKAKQAGKRDQRLKHQNDKLLRKKAPHALLHLHALLPSEPCPSETTAGSSTDSSGNDEIDVNTYCMCFGHYEDDVLEGAGVDWIFCKCGRWLHEDCVNEVVKDNDGEGDSVHFV